ESRGSENISESRLPGTPCHRAVPGSHPARRLGCGTPRLRRHLLFSCPRRPGLPLQEHTKYWRIRKRAFGSRDAPVSTY
ncbi:hypothetical protein EI555_010394, partial [Monodon monoceros]